MSSNQFLERILEPPAYGWSRDGEFYKPTFRELMSHWFSRMNLFASRKNWLPVTGWAWNRSVEVLFLRVVPVGPMVVGWDSAVMVPPLNANELEAEVQVARTYLAERMRDLSAQGVSNTRRQATRR